MTRLHAANTLAGLGRSSSGIVENTAVAASYDSSLVPNSIFVPVGASGTASPYLRTPVFAAQTDYWFHGEYYASTAPVYSDVPFIEFYNSSDVKVAELRHDPSAGAAWLFRYATAAGVFTASSTIVRPLATTRFRIDIHVVCGASGSWTIYLNGLAHATGPIAHAFTNNIAYVRLYHPGNGSSGYWSQILGADFDTRDSRYQLSPINGLSAANTDGSGAYTDVNENPLSEVTAISIPTSGQKRGLTHSAITVSSGMSIGAAVLNARGRALGTVTDGKLGIRSGGVNYSGSALSFNGGYEPRGYITELDPNTAAPWTEAGFNAAETFLEAV